MPKDWTDITDDEVLNFDGSLTAIIARYERIMDQKTINALMEVRMGLHDVKKSMHVVTDKLEARLIEAEKIQKEAATSQHKLQWVTIALTVVIALSTVAYTWITWQSVQAQREANQIQPVCRAQ
jgi:predicted phosphoadenosine phosphosulfate sulfurtransferase